MTYIFVYFIPGAAGNFLSRCLNLLDNAYCWANNDILPVDIDDKKQILNYESTKPNDWIQFEFQLKHYSEFRSYQNLPINAKSIWIQHPNFDMIERSLPGTDDQVVCVYIDPKHCFEWCVMNSLYKNTWIDAKWIEAGKSLSTRADMTVIDLKKIKTSWQDFLQEFTVITNAINHQLSLEELTSLQELYQQWQNTTLKQEDIPKFKLQLGWYNT